MHIRLSNEAYAHLATLPYHAHRHTPRRIYSPNAAGYDYDSQATAYQTTNGLSKYLNAFASQAPHPYTFIIDAQTTQPPIPPLDPIGTITAHAHTHEPTNSAGPEYTPTAYMIENDPKHPMPMNWMVYHKADDAPAWLHANGPVCTLLSPYDINTYGIWVVDASDTTYDPATEGSPDTWDPTNHDNPRPIPKWKQSQLTTNPDGSTTYPVWVEPGLKPRELRLTPNTINYLAQLGTWFRIPVISTTMRNSRARPNDPIMIDDPLPPISLKRPTLTIRAGATLEAIGLQFLTHPLLVSESPRPHNAPRRGQALEDHSALSKLGYYGVEPT